MERNITVIEFMCGINMIDVKDVSKAIKYHMNECKNEHCVKECEEDLKVYG